jgi:hypothetical protein
MVVEQDRVNRLSPIETALASIYNLREVGLAGRSGGRRNGDGSA